MRPGVIGSTDVGVNLREGDAPGQKRPGSGCTPGNLRLLAFLVLSLGGWAEGQEKPADALQRPLASEAPKAPRVVEWKEGVELRVRVPVATDKREVMSTVAFPEGGIQAAVTGWSSTSITATQKGGFLFLKLQKQSEGQINVLGDSGTHYLLYVEGVLPEAPGGYDSYLKISRPGWDSRKQDSKDPAGRKSEHPRPKGALDLMRSLRMGTRPEGWRILRAKGELLYAAPDIEIRLLFVYDGSPYIGRIYEVRNLSAGSIALDASRFRAAGEGLILSGLRENVIPAGRSTHLYTIFWKA
jgi:hypothetical protein